jgi:hypothetical protein
VPRVPVAAVVAALALVASACGGDGGNGGSGSAGTAPDQYAATVCGALTAWQNELQEKAGAMGTAFSGASGPADVKTKLVEFMQAMSTSTNTMVSKVRAAGPPDVEDGAALHRDLVSGLEDAQKAFDDARESAEALPTDDPAAFQQQATQLGTTLSEQGTAIGSTFTGLSTKYDSRELNEAFNSEPACQNLS